MKTKVMATMLLLTMLVGTIGAFMPRATADTTTKFLTMAYCPGDMPPPETLPSLGVHELTQGSQINIEAPEYVADTTGVRYKFDHWGIWWEETETWYNTTNRNHTVDLSENKTAYACYVKQYLLTAVTAFDTMWIYDPVTGWHIETTRWFNAGQAGVKVGLSVGAVWIESYHWAIFDNWGGDATGNDFDPSDPITMDGPKTAVAIWHEEYYLMTDSSYYPWGGGSPYDPSVDAYYEYCTYVDLTAPTYDQVNPGNWRWRFDRWEIEKYNHTSAAWELAYTESTEDITVHIDHPTKAIVYYHLQYYLTVADSPGYLVTGLESYTGYYDYCTYVTITAPSIVPDPFDPIGTRWVFKQWYLAGVFDHWDEEVTVHIEHATCVGQTLYAIYTKQYYLTVNDDIGGLSGVFTQSGWFAAGAVVPLNAPSIVPVNSGTRYTFIKWIKNPGGVVAWTTATTITMNAPRFATAYYQLQYKRTWVDNVSGAILPYGEDWQNAGALVWWFAPTGPVTIGLYDYYFDHWEVNGVPYTQYWNWIQVLQNGPKNGIAYYVAAPAFFITPGSVVVDAPAACTYFEVNVTAANLVDLYAMDFQVFWDTTLLELVEVDVEVGEIWTDYFIAKNEIDNDVGMYWFAATSLDGAPEDPYGFTGTHKIVKLKFHIIYDPCWIEQNYYRYCDIPLVIHQLADSDAHAISPFTQHGGYYRINAIQPIIEMRPGLVEAHSKNYEFTVEIWIDNAVKLHDWGAIIVFDTNQLDIVSVEIDTTFLTGPYEYFLIWKNDAQGYIEMHVRQQQPGETLAYGEGRLATLRFKVHDWIYWTVHEPELNSWISFVDFYLSVKCPLYNVIDDSLLELHSCMYQYTPVPGDVNGDGVVNVLDLQLVASTYMKNPGPGYNLDCDGDTDLIDLVLVAINFGRDEP